VVAGCRVTVAPTRWTERRVGVQGKPSNDEVGQRSITMATAVCYLFFDTISKRWRVRTRDNFYYLGEIPFKVIIHYDLQPIIETLLEADVSTLNPKVQEGIIEALQNAERAEEE